MGRLADNVLEQAGSKTFPKVIGVSFMNQCKRPCIASLTAKNCFTYLYGDLDPEKPDHVKALLDIISRYKISEEGFMTREDRPKPLRTNILGRIPPIGSMSPLVTSLKKGLKL